MIIEENGKKFSVDDVTGGKKEVKDVQLSLVPVDFLKELGRIYAYGAQKYARSNWLRGYDWHLSYDALQRHLMAFWGGEEIDPESGLSHLGHAAFHCAALFVFWKRGIGLDDRETSRTKPEVCIDPAKKAQEDDPRTWIETERRWPKVKKPLPNVETNCN